MNDPASKDDVDSARDKIIERIDAMDRNVEGMRSQNSAEHGSLYFILQNIREALNWIRSKWERFTRAP